MCDIISGMDRKDTMSDPKYGFAGELAEMLDTIIPPTRMSEQLPPVTCGQELADGNRCDRPTLHAGDHGDTNGTGCFCQINGVTCRYHPNSY